MKYEVNEIEENYFARLKELRFEWERGEFTWTEYMDKKHELWSAYKSSLSFLANPYEFLIK